VLKDRKRKRKPAFGLHLTNEARYHSTRAAAETFARASTQLQVASLDCTRADGSLDEAQYRKRERQIRRVPVTPESLRCHRYDGICAGETYVLWDRRCLRHGLARELARSAALGVGAAVRGVAQRVLAPALQHGRIAELQASACRELAAAGPDGRAVLAGTASPETVHRVLAAAEQGAAASAGRSSAAVAGSAVPLQLVDATVLRRAVDGVGLHNPFPRGAPKRSRSRAAAEETADSSVGPAAHADAADASSSSSALPLSSSSSSLSASPFSSLSASSSEPAAPVSALGRLVALAQAPLPQIAPADATALLAQVMPGQTDTLRMPLYSHAFAFARVADRREAMGLAREAAARVGAPLQHLTLA
jgi:hypothetical protein